MLARGLKLGNSRKWRSRFRCVSQNAMPRLVCRDPIWGCDKRAMVEWRPTRMRNVWPERVEASIAAGKFPGSLLDGGDSF